MNTPARIALTEKEPEQMRKHRAELSPPRSARGKRLRATLHRCFARD
jgi:hypothetical protein